MGDIALSTVDLSIIAVYFLLVFVIGFRMARRTHSGEDLFLAGIDATLDAWLGNVYFRRPTGDCPPG